MLLLWITTDIVRMVADKFLGRSEETRQLYSILKPARKRSWRLRVSWLVIYWLLCWTIILLKNWFDYTHYRFGNLGLVVTKIKFHKNLHLGRFTPKTCRIWDIQTWKETNLGIWDLGLPNWGDEVWVSVTEFTAGYLIVPKVQWPYMIICVTIMDYQRPLIVLTVLESITLLNLKSSDSIWNYYDPAGYQVLFIKHLSTSG